MPTSLDPLLDAFLDRIAARLGAAPAVFPGEFVGPGNNSQRSLFNGTATTTFTTGPFVNPNGRFGLFTLNVTAASGGPSLTLAFQGLNKDGVAFPLLTAVAVTAITATALVYQIGPGLPAAAASANVPFPAQYQVLHTIAGSLTYTLDLDLT